jgi:hypothetical protein
MSNMSYCRFENTVSDLEDCVESWSDGVSSKDEAQARQRLVRVAEELLSLYRSDREMVDSLELNEEGKSYEADDDDTEDEDNESESDTE